MRFEWDPRKAAANVDKHDVSFGEARTAFDDPGGRVAKSAGRMPHRNIDFSDIPELSAEQLANMRRVGRPPLGDRPKTPISIRLDQKVLDWVKRTAARLDRPYQSLISEILEKEMKKAG